MSVYIAKPDHAERVRATIDQFLAESPRRPWDELARALVPDGSTPCRAEINWTIQLAKGHLAKRLGRQSAELGAAGLAIVALGALAGLAASDVKAVPSVVAAAPAAASPVAEQGRELPLRAPSDQQTVAPETVGQGPSSAGPPPSEPRPSPGRHRQATSGKRAQTLETIAQAKAPFAGLPAGVTHPSQLLAAFKKAAPYLGISRRAVDLVDHLFAHTRPQDWSADSRPVVWPSNRFLEEALQLSGRRVKELVRAVHELRLVAMRDNPAGKRHGRRDPQTGKLVLAATFGFDLSPLADRHAEFVKAAADGRADYDARAAAARVARIAKHRIVQCLTTADELGLWSTYWEGLEARTLPLFPVIEASRLRAELEHIAATLKAAATDAETTLAASRSASEPQAVDIPVHQGRETAPSGAEDRTLKNYTNTPSAFEKAVQAQQDGTTYNHPPKPQDHGEADYGNQRVRLTPQELCELVPTLGQYAPDNPSWQDLGRIVSGLCLRHGIAQRIWWQAIRNMSESAAVVAFAIALSKPDGHIRNGLGAYFASLVALAEQGRLDLGRSVYGLRRHALDTLGSGLSKITTGGVKPVGAHLSASFDQVATEHRRQAWLAGLKPEEKARLDAARRAEIARRIADNARRS